MIVYSFEKTGLFSGEIQLDESDKSPLEPEVYLIPAGCTDIEPPNGVAGFDLIFDGTDWCLLPTPNIEPDATPDPPAPPAIPISITPRQGYIILSRYGLLESVRTYFAALEGQEGEEAKIELQFAQEWKRTWPTLINAAHAFGLTDAQIDQMFIEASVI